MKCDHLSKTSFWILYKGVDELIQHGQKLNFIFIYEVLLILRLRKICLVREVS